MNPAIDLALTLIKNFEGCSLKAYRCPAGKWTIGYGHAGSDVHQGMTWTQEQADEQLLDDVTTVHTLLLSTSPVLRNETDNRIAGLISFAFNVGIGSYRASTLKQCVDAKDWQEAQHEIKRWDKATISGEKVVVPGLVTRRAKEAEYLK